MAENIIGVVGVMMIKGDKENLDIFNVIKLKALKQTSFATECSSCLLGTEIFSGVSGPWKSCPL